MTDKLSIETYLALHEQSRNCPHLREMWAMMHDDGVSADEAFARTLIAMSRALQDAEANSASALAEKIIRRTYCIG